MNAAELAAKVEERFPCVSGMYAAHCQTGDLYQTFSFHGRDEGALYVKMRTKIWWYFSQWRKEHGRSAKPSLYWRYATRIEFIPEDHHLISRLVLSDKPVVWDSVEAYDAWRTKQLEREHFPREITDGRQ